MRCSMYAKGKRQGTFGRRSILIRQLPGHRRDKGRQVAMQTVEIESMAAMAKRQQISCVTMCSKRSWSHESRDADIYLNLVVVTIDGREVTTIKKSNWLKTITIYSLKPMPQIFPRVYCAVVAGGGNLRQIRDLGTRRGVSLSPAHATQTRKRVAPELSRSFPSRSSRQSCARDTKRAGEYELRWFLLVFAC